MKEVILTEKIRLDLVEIYTQLQQEYERVAEELVFSCESCPDNCCDSYFLHYTYVEWAYLWEGIQKLEPSVRENLIERANKYLEKCKQSMDKGEIPQVMCPLNDKGLCTLYEQRLLVCRTHGVPAVMTRPDGQTMRFPGCFRCQEIVDEKQLESPPYVERTQLLRKLALLEQELLLNKRHLVPKVKLTIAEMIVNGPPSVGENSL